MVTKSHGPPSKHAQVEEDPSVSSSGAGHPTAVHAGHRQGRGHLLQCSILIGARVWS